MVNVFNDRVAGEGKTEVVEKGDPDGTLFLINPEVRLLFIKIQQVILFEQNVLPSMHLQSAILSSYVFELCFIKWLSD